MKPMEHGKFIKISHNKPINYILFCDKCAGLGKYLSLSSRDIISVRGLITLTFGSGRSLTKRQFEVAVKVNYVVKTISPELRKKMDAMWDQFVQNVKDNGVKHEVTEDKMVFHDFENW